MLEIASFDKCTTKLALFFTIKLIAAGDEEERNLRRVSYLQATKEERMETEEK